MNRGTGARAYSRTEFSWWGLFCASVRLCVCAAALSSCAYYNGMYNANRYARQAERSERSGRTGEAADRWLQAAMHAESVTVRHPKSRWADDALLVRGRALVHLESWNDAVTVLTDAVRAAPAGEQRREAQLNLGRANLAMHRHAEALLALDSAVPSGVASRRSEALLYRGRTWMAMGRPPEALRDFNASERIEARYDRVGAALALHDTAAAVEMAASLVTRRFIEGLWVPLLDGLGRVGQSAEAGVLVDQLVARHDVTPGARARLMLADGDRRAAHGDSAAAAERYRETVRAVPDSSEARTAVVRLVRMELRSAHDSSDVSLARERLDQIALLGGSSGQEAGEVLRLLRRADSLAAATASPDAFWFLRAELLRDSLGATALAASAFAAMAELFPASPWTPKGLFAAIVLGGPDADALRAQLAANYPESPYTRIATGGGDAPERFAALEDSLRLVLASGSVAAEAREVGPEDRPDAIPGRRPPERPVHTPAQQPVRPVPTSRPTIEP